MTPLSSPFCLTNNNGEPYGDVLGLNLPDFSNFEMYLLVPTISTGESWNVGRYGGALFSLISISWSTLRAGESPSGRSSTITDSYFLSTSSNYMFAFIIEMFDLLPLEVILWSKCFLAFHFAIRMMDRNFRTLIFPITTCPLHLSSNFGSSFLLFCNIFPVPCVHAMAYQEKHHIWCLK